MLFAEDPLRDVESPLRDTKCPLVVHQCDCIARRPRGRMEHAISDIGVDPYVRRAGVDDLAHESDRSKPGTVEFVRSDRLGVTVANMFTQYAPGLPGNASRRHVSAAEEDGYRDDAEQRKTWLRSCLEKVAEFARAHKVKKVAMPAREGIGLAGGDPVLHRRILSDWARSNGLEIDLHRK